jgi:predicted nucleic-acid-binding protein
LKIGVDTNVLVRVLIGDDKRQSVVAEATLAKADGVMISVLSLCELVWVLQQGYGVPRYEILRAIMVLIDSENVVVDLPVFEAGLAMFEAGGDFADGVIAFGGYQLGAKEFVSFDKKAVELTLAQCKQALLL